MPYNECKEWRGDVGESSLLLIHMVVRQNECKMMIYYHDISFNKIKRVMNISHEVHHENSYRDHNV